MAEIIATDGVNLYWISQTGVYKSPVSGGAPTQLAPVAPPDAAPMFVDGFGLHGDRLFWTTGAVAGLDLGLVQSVLADGGSLTMLAPPNQNGLAITADDNNAYWADLGGLKRSNPDGGTPFVMNATEPSNPVVVGGTVYWARAAVMATPANGSGGAPLTGTFITGEARIAADATRVYVFDVNAGAISTVSVNGGDASTIATVGSDGIVAIAIDSTNVYYSTNPSGNPTDGYIAKIPLTGGTSTKIASGFKDCSTIAVDNTSVYWTYQGSIRRAPK